MTESAAELRRHAVECMACAENAVEIATRDAWLEMAQKWLRLAEKTEGRHGYSKSKVAKTAYIGEWVLPCASTREQAHTVWALHGR